MISSGVLPSLSFASSASLKAVSSSFVKEAAEYSNRPISLGSYVMWSLSHMSTRVSFFGFSMNRPKIFVTVLWEEPISSARSLRVSSLSVHVTTRFLFSKSAILSIALFGSVFPFYYLMNFSVLVEGWVLSGYEKSSLKAKQSTYKQYCKITMTLRFAML